LSYNSPSYIIHTFNLAGRCFLWWWWTLSCSLSPSQRLSLPGRSPSPPAWKPSGMEARTESSRKLPLR